MTYIEILSWSDPDLECKFRDECAWEQYARRQDRLREIDQELAARRAAKHKEEEFDWNTLEY